MGKSIKIVLLTLTSVIVLLVPTNSDAASVSGTQQTKVKRAAVNGQEKGKIESAGQAPIVSKRLKRQHLYDQSDSDDYYDYSWEIPHKPKQPIQHNILYRQYIFEAPHSPPRGDKYSPVRSEEINPDVDPGVNPNMDPDMEQDGDSENGDPAEARRVRPPKQTGRPPKQTGRPPKPDVAAKIPRPPKKTGRPPKPDLRP